MNEANSPNETKESSVANDLAQLQAKANALPGVADLMRLHSTLAETNRVAAAYTVRNGRAIAFSSSNHTS